MSGQVTIHDYVTRRTAKIIPYDSSITSDLIFRLPKFSGTLLTKEQLTDISTLPAEFISSIRGESGRGVEGIIKYATTASNGKFGQPGATDTYRMIFTDKTFYDFIMYNGPDMSNTPSNDSMMMAITTALNDTIGLAPENLNTIQEIAEKLLENINDDETNLVTIMAGISGNKTDISKLQKDVDDLLDVKQNRQSADYTLALTDRGKSIDTTAGINIPADSSVNFPIGSIVGFQSLSLAETNIIPAAGVTLFLAGSTLSGQRKVKNYGSGFLRKVNSNVWVITGNGIL